MLIAHTNRLLREAVRLGSIPIFKDEAVALLELYNSTDSVEFTTNSGESFKVINWSKVSFGSNRIVLSHIFEVTSSMSNQDVRTSHGQRV